MSCAPTKVLSTLEVEDHFGSIQLHEMLQTYTVREPFTFPYSCILRFELENHWMEQLYLPGTPRLNTVSARLALQNPHVDP